MKALVINNNTKYLKELLDKLSELNISYDVFDEKHIPGHSGYDLIILTGGSSPGIIKSPERFSEEIKLLKSGIPVLGICLGFEVIAYNFGCKLDSWKEKKTGMINLEGVGDVFEAHKYFVKTDDVALKRHFKIIAKTDDYAQIIRHKTLPIVGVQFHPEKSTISVFRKVMELIH